MVVIAPDKFFFLLDNTILFDQMHKVKKTAYPK